MGRLIKFLTKNLFIFLIICLFTFPVQAVEGDILFADDFNDGNMDGWVIESGHWSIQDGVLIAKESGTIDFLGRINQDAEWDNYILELDVNNVKGVDEAVVFRKTGDLDGYAFNFRHGTGAHNTPEIKFYKTQDEIATELASIKNQQLLNNTWYHISVEVDQENIKLFVDNNKLFEFTDSDNPIKQGGISLLSWTGAIGSIEVKFDNIKVTSLDSHPPSSPPPTPFLDLPWDYESKGLSFNEAALSMFSFFDHTYPLLSSSLAEPADVANNIMKFEGVVTSEPYSSHDGYDYAKKAGIKVGDPAIAAASGWATYAYDEDTIGNAILIDHDNGYQTRYYHLLPDGLITKESKVWVEAGSQIGQVGSTGNSSGAHIHFMVVQDKNNDGNFEDNLPDGVTDPFGWQSKETDPWPLYSFFYNGLDRTGNISYYLWKNKLDNLDATLSSNGGVFKTERYNLDFPEGSTDQNLNLSIKSSPIVQASQTLVSIGSTIVAEATDLLGNLVANFLKPFTLSVDYSTFDLTRYNPNTISIYSSQDGVNWTKEETLVDPITKTASAQLSHFTYFALMAERIDTVPPITIPVLDGQAGQDNWFRSEVQVTLDTQDNEGGLGVDYTMYRLEGGDWEIYTHPFTINSEGSYKIEFYSADKDENLEEIKLVEFDIDKTLPQASIDANPKSLWPPNGKISEIIVNGSSNDDHLYKTKLIVDDEYNIYGSTQIVNNNFNSIILLEANREGSDLDGRLYIIKVIAEDLAGNITEEQVEVIVPHDQGK